MILRPVLVPIQQTAAERTPEQVAAQRTAAKRALRRCAQLCDAPTDGWQKDNSGAPLPQGGFHWSIAHKRAWAAAVVADHPVGIDIEKIVPKRDDDILDEVATAEEWKRIGHRCWESFYRVWTAKEATLKAAGVGIKGLGECLIVGTPDDRRMQLEYAGQPWRVEHYYHEGHVAAVTCGPQPVDWRVIADKDATS